MVLNPFRKLKLVWGYVWMAMVHDASPPIGKGSPLVQHSIPVPAPDRGAECTTTNECECRARIIGNVAIR